MLLHNLLSLPTAGMLMSFSEYSTHRWMLHTNTFTRLFPRVDKFQEVLRDHAVNHHARNYKCFNREDDPEGKYVGLFFPLGYYQLLVVFVSGPLLFYDWLTALYFAGFAVAHYVLWNKFHMAMHFNQPTGRLWMLWFRYVEYHHFLHHQHRNKNFNGLLPPLWDWLLGTLAKATAEDLKVWRLLQAGEFVDHRGRPLALNSAE
jgi:hypothetical protein